MSKKITYQGFQIDAQAKIAIEALILKAQRNQIFLAITDAHNREITLHLNHFDSIKFIQTEARKYGFVLKENHPNQLIFIGLKKSNPVTSKRN